MGSSSNGKKWDPRVQKVLVDYRDAREQQMKREQELIRERKEKESELRDLGHMPSAAKVGVTAVMNGTLNEKQAKILVARSEYTHIVFSLKWVRDAIKTLADKIDQTIHDADQGKLKFAAEDEQDLGDLGREPDEKLVFARPPEPPPAPKKGDNDQMELGVDQQLAVSVKELELPATLTAKLEAGGFDTVAKLAFAFDHENGDDHQKLIDNLTDVQYTKTAGALRDFRKRHRDVKDKEPEPDAEPAHAG